MAGSDKKYREIFLATYALLRIPMMETSEALFPGIVLVADDMKAAKTLEKKLVKTSWAQKSVDSYPRNYQIGTRIIWKHDCEEEINRFLNKEEFLPVAIAAGIVPEYIEDGCIVFRMKEKISKEAISEFEKFREWIIENLEAVLLELKILANLIENSESFQNMSAYFHVFYLVGGLWKMYIRSKVFDETEVDRWMKKYMEWVTNLLEESEGLSGVYQVTEAVKYFMFRYLEEGNLPFVCKITEIKDYEIEEIIEESIFFDDDSYFVTETLFRKICAPLTDSVPFLQIKKELEGEGTLICNQTEKHNFTVKKTILLGDKVIRKRFIALRKNVFISEDGENIEEVIESYRSKMEVYIYETGEV